MDMIGDVVIGDGMETFRQQIYTAVHYRKKYKELKRKAEMQLSGDSGDDTSECRLKKSRQQGEYGCVEYQPLLPLSESATSQNEKKLRLIDFYKKAEDDDSKILALIDDTYAIQRVNINDNQDFEKLFIEWPYLISHASRLLGKPVAKVYRKNEGG